MNIKIIIISILLCIYCILLPFDGVAARQGCCSHHGGVCGCRCCDGTALSATCAPYYPSCEAPKIKVQKPAPKEHQNNAYEYYQVPDEPVLNNDSYDFKAQATPEKKNYNWLFWLGGISIFGFLIYVWKNYDKKD